MRVPAVTEVCFPVAGAFPDPGWSAAARPCRCRSRANEASRPARCGEIGNAGRRIREALLEIRTEISGLSAEHMDLFTITNSPTPPTTYCAPGRKRISLICYLRLQRRINFDDPASEED
jgi:hypothetical protein